MRSIHTKIKPEFEPLLAELALHALLHLRTNHTAIVLGSKSRSQINDILSAWLNKAANSKKYKPFKKKVKSLVSHARSQRLDMEAMLGNLLTPIEGDELPHLDSFLLLVNTLEKELNTTVLVSSPEAVDLQHNSKGCLLCVLSADLNAHFNNRNRLVANISMLFRGTHGEKHSFLRTIYSSSLFDHHIEFEDGDFVRITLSLR
ncbi:DUF2913 domain-containing protein [Vibrio tubiashii]|uniref:DUF2913 domain-containing protein n=2 Tax=Vibrio tubiashii TaxID=29498 RepID=F9TCP1_9VIBR|nr:DUF2913 family protein [Vibrio tubiashii]AIW14641.1 hypothetical protein IX91_10570 [Vibrio tubiashii ATCC 19109]EGU47704.1 hypothetical protein VITU9109_20806 [Vibrio tubiashii ATCC 19109]EIF02442.1 hypothetical protein VT1337_18816 [Vibrio tubiashii NCIMB 1337 = ATCC 19106]MCG9581929.1 DUF2913 family protein [Vibrio tubiashii]MCG9615520.1 DUF2913 family protein [Vibrio tubiashii]